MKIDKTKRDEAVRLMHEIHSLAEPYSSGAIQSFVDTLLAAIVPDEASPTTLYEQIFTTPPYHPDINDHVDVPDSWLTRDSVNDWHLSFGDLPQFSHVNLAWSHGQYNVVKIDHVLRPAESLHKAVNGKWVRWDHETNQPIEQPCT